MIKNDTLKAQELQKHIKEYPDFPKKGIVFGDIMPLFSTPTLLHNTIDLLRHNAEQMHHFDTIVGIESRGFLLATPLALHMGKGFIPARKKGKLPGTVVSETYSLEYGTDTIEVQKEGILPNTNYIILDDILATGGTATATAKLIQKNGGNIVGFLFLIELKDLGGRHFLENNIPSIPCYSIITL